MVFSLHLPNNRTQRNARSLATKDEGFRFAQLKGVLDYGNFVLPLKENEPVALRVRFGNEKGTSTVFEITSLEHESWVSP